MGLAASHRVWNPALIDGLADGGYRVVLLDNRDVGQSSRIEGQGKLWLGWQLLKYQIGWKVNSPYTLKEMAADAVSVLDALDIDRAHVIGASMGGMISQVIAYDYERLSPWSRLCPRLGPRICHLRQGSAAGHFRYE